jgi:hypothetical protein
VEEVALRAGGSRMRSRERTRKKESACSARNDSTGPEAGLMGKVRAEISPGGIGSLNESHLLFARDGLDVLNVTRLRRSVFWLSFPSPYGLG